MAKLPSSEGPARATCQVCGTQVTGTLGDHPDFSASVFRCRSCGLVQTSALPEGTLHAFYEHTYREARREEPTESLLRYLSHRATQQRAFIEEQAGDRFVGWSGLEVLDIGAGFGILAKALTALGCRVSAVEPDPRAARLLRAELGIRCTPHLDPELKSAFDVIVASHVLEHVADPVAFGSRLANALKPGGLLFIEVPCDDPEAVQAAVADQKGGTGHLLFFNEATLRTTLGKTPLLRVIRVLRAGPPLREFLETGKLDITRDAGAGGTWLRALLQRHNPPGEPGRGATNHNASE